MPHTPFGFLFHQAFVQQETSFGERGNRVSLTPKAGETILVFRTDDGKSAQGKGASGPGVGTFCDHFGVPKTEPRCDFLLFYALERANAPSPLYRLAFIELKGNDMVHAATQIENVMRAVRRKLEPLIGPTLFERQNLRALVVSQRSAPQQFQKAQLRFEREVGIALRQCRPNETEIRQHLLNGQSG